MKRMLCFWERIFVTANQEGCLSPSLWIKVKGKLPAEDVDQCWRLMRKRHPMLNSKIVINEKRMYFVTDDTLPINIQHRYFENQKILSDFFENQAYTVFPLDLLPWKVTLSLDQTSSLPLVTDIILTSHHAIMDGAGMFHIIKELFAIYRKQQHLSEKFTLSPEQKNPYLISFAEAVSYNFNSFVVLGGMYYLIKNLSRTFINKIPRSWHQTTTEFKLLFTRDSLSKEETAALHQACKKHQTTFHSAICAATYIAFHRIFSHLIPKITATSSFDTRPYCLDQISRQSLLMGQSITTHLNGVAMDKMDFWSLAKKAKQKLSKNIKKELKIIAALYAIDPLINAKKIFKKRRMLSHIHVSNLGQQRILDQGMDFSVEEAWGFASETKKPIFYFQHWITTVNDCLFITTGYHNLLPPLAADKYQNMVLELLMMQANTSNI